MNPDASLLSFVAGHRDAVLTGLARLAMAVGTNKVVLLAVGIVAASFMVARRWCREGLAVGSALVISAVLVTGLKHLIQRPRPPFSLALARVGGWSMPSTEAAVTAALAVTVVVVFDWQSETVRRGLGGALLAAVIAVGGAMVYLGVHWLTDVLVGWLLGAAIGGASALLLRPARRLPGVG